MVRVQGQQSCLSFFDLTSDFVFPVLNKHYSLMAFTAQLINTTLAVYAETLNLN